MLANANAERDAGGRGGERETKYKKGVQNFATQLNAIHCRFLPQEGKTSVATKQIELDLMRTFPTHRDYSNPDSEHIQRLRRVLVAYSWHHDNVG